ncbi:MAG: type II secretion system protein [Candidatus Gastranaerophilales bacterium]|nr:type II secretion system protein [Candidatus Gastranaerophilales bacterium]
MKRRAFTLAEVLIVFSVIGVLAVIVLSSLSGVRPDKEKTMFKKAYSITERAVGELVNDETIYPYDPDRIGFYNTDAAEVEGTALTFNGAQKFCMFFSRKLNTFAEAQFDGTRCTFETSDGITWSVPSNFDRTAGNSSMVVRVDVNADKDPNFPNYTSEQVAANPQILNDTNAELANQKRDIFFIFVDFDGRVRVPAGSREETFLKSHEARERRL